MRKYNEPNYAKYITAGVMFVIFLAFISVVVFGIMDMKNDLREKQRLINYLNQNCQVLEYGLDQQPSKYSCDGNIVISTK